ncbi:hypothetical protein [Enterococcus sp.]|uniref:hypothetical protein n=1 Tax=Enterococcus sp. TaxID=35783 RepID=UPI002FCBFB5F
MMPYKEYADRLQEGKYTLAEFPDYTILESEDSSLVVLWHENMGTMWQKDAQLLASLNEENSAVLYEKEFEMLKNALYEWENADDPDEKDSQKQYIEDTWFTWF